MSRHRKNKNKGCSKGVIIVIALLVATIILVCTGVVDNIKKQVDRKIYPLEYKEEILSLCEEYDFEPAFVCALIYTESKFRPDAQSHAGAKGLMQLMPETFMDMARRKGEEVTESDIFNPHINLRYGVYYLHYLMNTYGFQDKYLCAAAYNAGPGAVSRWLDNKEYSDDGITLKYIPYEETSDYVEKIKKAERMYQNLYFD